MNPLKISVAIATFNRAEMVKSAIGAALQQSREPWEVVVADDASTDSTSAVLQGMVARDPRIRTLRRLSNSGGVENWNLAMDAAQGDLIAWCSDDDRFLPGHLESSAAYLEAHPEIMMVHAGFVDLRQTSTSEWCEPRPLRWLEAHITRATELLPYLIRYYDWPFHPSTLVMRRHVWDTVGNFNPAYSLADTDWFVRAVETFPIAYLPHLGVLNRRHSGNWSNRLGSAKMQAEIRQIGEGVIDRRYPKASAQSIFWRALWRANVRLRLGLTILARIQSGHADAACAAWTALAKDAGFRIPQAAVSGIAALARNMAKRNATRCGLLAEEQSVIPL